MSDSAPNFVIRARLNINGTVAGAKFKWGTAYTPDPKIANACAARGFTVTNPYTGLTIKGPQPAERGRL